MLPTFFGVAKGGDVKLQIMSLSSEVDAVRSGDAHDTSQDRFMAQQYLIWKPLSIIINIVI
jgi:hypothetical protein